MTERAITGDIDTAKLIAQARGSDPNRYADPYTRIAWWEELAEKLAAALEAAEKRGEEESERLHRAEQGWADEARRAEAAEAQRDALAKAILAALNELAVKEARAAVPLINEKVRERDAALVERDALQGDVDKLVGKIGGLTGEIRRLREALEQIASDIHPARPVDEERPRWLDENSVWWNHLSPQEIARAALAGSGDE